MAHWELEPTVSRVVHYVPTLRAPDDIPVCCAAMVTAVSAEGAVSLKVMAPYGLYDIDDVRHDEALQESNGFRDHVENTWHWPEMVNTGFSMKVVSDGNPSAGAE